jgi:predicted dehydrogenase
MKILFIGLGSIGQRHLQNFQELYSDKHTIFCLRESKSNLYIKNGKALSVDNLANQYAITEITNIDDALNVKPDIVFITNPSSKHIDFSLKFAKIGAHLFIEKPLSTSMKNIHKLKKHIESKKLICMIAYQARFHPLISMISKIIQSKKYGKIISAHIEWGTYLPDHHKYEDYKISYASRKDLGGGVLLSLIHEIDILLYLFGKPTKFYAIESTTSNLGIDVEDTVFSLFQYKKNNNSFPVSLSLSFAQVHETRSIKISFQDAFLTFDWSTNIINIFNNEKLIKTYNVSNNFERNTMFIDELKYFMNCIKHNKTAIPNIDDGIESLKLTLNIQKEIK